VIACSRLDDMVDSEIRRYGKLLEAVVKLSDLSTRELERRLDLGGGTLNRIFTGKIDLKLRHILLVLEVVGMKPERFFQLACARPAAAGDEAGSALAAEILESFQRFGYSIGRPPAPLPDRQLSDDELDRRIEAALGRVLGRTAPEPAGRRAEPGLAAPGKPAGDPSSD
jgi:transcriptional regulator with XRE-family HTH domain